MISCEFKQAAQHNVYQARKTTFDLLWGTQIIRGMRDYAEKQDADRVVGTNLRAATSVQFCH